MAVTEFIHSSALNTFRSCLHIQKGDTVPLFEFACYKNVYIIKKKYQNVNLYNDKSCSDSSNKTVNITCQCISISTLII